MGHISIKQATAGLFATAVCIASAQNEPHLGYTYPAGGQQGTVFEVVLGGQHLDGTVAAYISGEGVQAEVIEHIRPLNQGAFKEIQRQIGRLRAKKDAAAGEAGRGRRRNQSFTNEAWTVEDEMRLEALRSKLSTFSIRKTSVPALVETVTLKVTVDAAAVPGRRELRLHAAKGLSNPLVFEVGRLPEAAEESARRQAVTESKKRGGRGRRKEQEIKPVPGVDPVKNDPQTEMQIKLPVTLNGQILPGDIDRYRFHACKGEQFVAVAKARELIPYLSDAVPGWFQAVLALHDVRGNEIAFADDFHHSPDPVLRCTIPEDGEYILEIRDALYRGREDFIYRISGGGSSVISDILPPEFPVNIAGGLPQCSDTEPNNTLTSAQRINGPVVVNGCINEPGDVDVFSFSCREGARIVAEVRARRLGSPMDSHLILSDTNGVTIAFNDDCEDKSDGLTTHHADSRIAFTAPRSGKYHLQLRDIQQQGGQEYRYRLHLDAQRPDFELRVVPSAVNARAGSTVPIRIYALRKDGCSTPIDLKLLNPPPGFKLDGGRVPAGKDTVLATLTVPAETRQEPYTLHLEGRTRIGKREIVKQAVPADDTMQAFIYHHLVPARILQVAVTDASRMATPHLLTTEPARIQQGGTARIKVEQAGQSRFGELRFDLLDPPPGLEIDEVSFDGAIGELTLKCESCAPNIKGNLVISVYVEKTGVTSRKGKEQHKRQRLPLGVLPAIPFEIQP